MTGIAVPQKHALCDVWLEAVISHQEGLARAVLGDKVGFLDQAWRWAIPPTFERARFYARHGHGPDRARPRPRRPQGNDPGPLADAG